jgi:hypothetical protein
MTMLYYCAYTWNPGVTVEEVGRSILEQHDAGTLRPEWIRGYYGLVGGGAGFLILEVDNPHALNEMLAPSMRYMTASLCRQRRRANQGQLPSRGPPRIRDGAPGQGATIHSAATVDRHQCAR